MNILYQERQIDGVQAPSLKADTTVVQAVNQLLHGSRFKANKVDAYTISIVPGPQADDKAPTSDSTQTPARLHLTSALESHTERTVAEERSSKSLAEVVVTAQKRDERLIDVPISIVAISGDTLEKRRLTTLEDLPSTVPGLSVSDTGSGRLIFLRGVSNITGTPLIGLYIDDADVTLGGGGAGEQLNPDLYDLERVEVLRGPQGTLYGEGSAGGTIRFITKKPELHQFAFDADVAALFTQSGAASQRINAMANIPLIDGQLGLRIVGTADHEGGWINQPAAGLSNINDRNLTAVRIEELWKPTSEFSASVMALLNREERGTDVTDLDSPSNYTQVLSLTTTPRLKNDYNLYNLTLTYDMPVARVLSTTGYLQSIIPIWNQSQTFQAVEPGTGPPYNFYAPFERTDDHVLSSELRLTSRDSAPWQWTLGGFYRRYMALNNFPLQYYVLPLPPGTPLSSYQGYPFFDNALYKSRSVFANTSYEFWARLTLGAGVRYFRENQVYNQSGLSTQTAQFHSIDPRYYVQYKLTKDVNVYSSAAKGFRSGGFNFGADQPPYGPESLWTYELGAKSLLLDGRLNTDIAIFRSDYTDYQTTGAPTATSVFPYTQNIGKAKIKGVEWDLTWRPTDKLSLSISGDYIDSRFTQVNATQTAYLARDSLDFTPKYQFMLSGERQFTVGGKQAFIRVDYSQQGRETYRNRSYGPWFFYESDVIHMLSANTGVQLNANLAINFFAQNVLNEQGFVSPFYGLSQGVRPRPPTYGVSFKVAFD